METKMFSVPVVIEVSGWISIKATSLEEAKQKAAQLESDDEIGFGALEDPEWHAEVMFDEIMPEEDFDYQ